LVATGEAGAAEAKMAMMTGGLVKGTLENDAGYSAEIELSPAKVGENMLMVTVKDPAGVIVQDATALEVTVALESAGISEVRLKAEAVGNGMWHVMIGETLIPGRLFDRLRQDQFLDDRHLEIVHASAVSALCCQRPALMNARTSADNRGSEGSCVYITWPPSR
jgi:hypothetical protein